MIINRAVGLRRVGGRGGLRALVVVTLAAVAAIAAASTVTAAAALIAFALIGLLALLAIPSEWVAGTALVVICGCVMVTGNATSPPVLWVATVPLVVTLAAIVWTRTTARPGTSMLMPGLILAWYVVLAASTVTANPDKITDFVIGAVVTVIAAFLTNRLGPTDMRIFALGYLLLGVLETGLACAELAVLKAPLFGYPLNDAGSPVIRLNSLLSDALPRTQGTAGHPLVFGFMLALAFVLAWANLARLRPWLRWSTVIVLGGGLVLSGTRSALAAAALGVFVVLFSGPNFGRKMRAIFVIAFGAAFAAVVWADLNETAVSITGEGDFTHRIGALDSVSNLLLRRPLNEVFLGSGWGSQKTLFARGLLQNDGFYAIDNEAVTVLALSGVIGAVAFAALAVVALVRADGQRRAVVIVVLVMLFSFDITTLYSTGTLMAVFLSYAARRPAARSSTATEAPPAPTRAELARI